MKNIEPDNKMFFDLKNYTLPRSESLPDSLIDEMTKILYKNLEPILKLGETRDRTNEKNNNHIDQRYVSHHIKVHKHGINYIDVLYDRDKKSYALILKKTNAQKTEGFSKEVCMQYLLQPDPESGILLSCRIVSVKAKEQKIAKSVLEETIDSGGIPFTCVSYSPTKNKPKRLHKPRAIQTYLGQTARELFLKFSQSTRKHQTADVCSYMLQIGKQLSTYHTKNVRTHFDIKTRNVLTNFHILDNGEKIRKFHLIDYPNEKDITKKGLELNPNHQFTYSQLLNKVDIGWGETTPIIKESPYFQGWNEFHNLLTYLGIKGDKHTQFLKKAFVEKNAAEHRVFGHACDSYGYLYSLYSIIKDNKALEIEFKPFLQDVMVKLIQTNFTSPKEWPRELTTAGILEAFGQYCRKNESLEKIMDKVEKSVNKLPKTSAYADIFDIAQQNNHNYVATFSRALKENIKQQFKIGFFMSILEWLQSLFIGQQTTYFTHQRVIRFIDNFDNIFSRSDTVFDDNEKKLVYKSLENISILLEKSDCHGPNVKKDLISVQKATLRFLKFHTKKSRTTQKNSLFYPEFRQNKPRSHSTPSTTLIKPSKPK
ncbi:MAG: hypothetical protein VX112_00900 [Pseudomonadota bacterium]|nr:hypothetical protein [Pseudomonadota bacterium]